MSLLRTKSIEASIADSEASEFQLKKNLSALDLTFFGIGVIIGAGIFTTAGRAAHTMAGPAIVISFIIGAICCGFAALCYAELSSTVPISGSAYTFSYATMGELVAWIVGWDLLLELVLASGVVAQGWSSYFQLLFGEWGFHLPKSLSTGTEWFGQFDLMAFLLVVVLTCLIAIGIKESLRVNLALVALKLFIVFFIIAMGIQYINTKNYHPFIPPSQTAKPPATMDRPLLELIFNIHPHLFGVMGVISAASLVFFAYIGFDVVATTAEETRNPKRDMPIGIIGSLIICTILYIAVSLVVTGMVRYDKIDPAAALASAFKDAGHSGYAQIISAGAVAGLATVVMTLMVGATRVVYAMARDGLLPIGIAKTNPKTGTPVRMTLGLGLIVALLTGIIPNGEFDEMVNIGTLSAFFLVSLAVPFLRKNRPDLERPFRVPLNPVVPALSALICLYLMLELPVMTWLRFAIWLIMGFVVFFGWGKWESRVGLGNDGFNAASIEHLDAVENEAVSQAMLPAIVTAVTAVAGLALFVFGPSTWWIYLIAFALATLPGLAVAHQLTGKARSNGVHTTRYLHSYWAVIGIAFLALLVTLFFKLG